MLDRLDAVAARHEEISRKLAEPGIAGDPAQYAALMKEYKKLAPLAEKYQEYRAARDSYTEAKEMLEEGGLDKDLRELCQEQLETSRNDLERLEPESCFFPRTPMMKKMSLWKSGAALAAKKLLYLPALYSVCIPCTRKARAGGGKY